MIKNVILQLILCPGGKYLPVRISPSFSAVVSYSNWSGRGSSPDLRWPFTLSDGLGPRISSSAVGGVTGRAIRGGIGNGGGQKCIW